jgi:ABC-type multidrug transport system fused ATPase/permease subunit
MSNTYNASTAHAYLVQLFKDFVREHTSLVVINMSFLLLYPIQDILLPHYYGKIMESLSSNRASAKSTIQKEVIVVVSLLVFNQVMFMVADFHNAKLIPIMESYIRSHIIKNLLDHHETQYEDLEVGEIITKIIKIPSVIVIWFDRMKSYILPYVLVYIFAFFYLAVYDIQLAIAFAITVTLLVNVLLSSPFSCAKISTARDKSFNNIHRQIDDILHNLFSIYGGNQKSQELQRLQAFAKEYSVHYESTMKCALRQMIFMNPVIIVFILFFVWRCSQLLQTKRMKTSTFVSIFVIFLYILNSVLILNDQLRDIIFEWGMIDASADLLFKQLQPSKAVVPALYADHMVSLPSEGIGLSNVTFAYPCNPRVILRNLSLHISPGERVCIIGNIGSGKSTIIKLLLKYHMPQEGVVYFNGQSYSDMSLPYIRQHIGYVPQHPVLFNRTLLENILYGNTHHNREDVERLLKYFHLDTEFAAIGLDTPIGKNGSKLSGGQRQIVWCMRVLLYDPDVLILDEPTASIDEKTKDILQNMLNMIMKNKTVIMVTHDPYLVKIATRIITISHGQIVSDARE